MWRQAAATGADLLWRVRKNILLPCEQRLPDGSYLSRIYPSPQDQRRQREVVLGALETDVEWGVVYNVARTADGSSFYLTKEWCECIRKPANSRVAPSDSAS